jgi:hypothetical protein
VREELRRLSKEFYADAIQRLTQRLKNGNNEGKGKGKDKGKVHPITGHED